jgi:DNA-binding protein H-NS
MNINEHKHVNDPKGYFVTYPQYFKFNNYTTSNLIHESDYNTYSKPDIDTDHRSVSPQCRSPVGSDFSENSTNPNLLNELFMKTKQIESLENELESMSKLYSDENLRQLEEMNRLIAVILEEKHQSTARLEKKIREQHDQVHLLSKKLASKNSLINKLNEENMYLRKHSNIYERNSPISDYSIPISNKMEYDVRYSPSISVQNPSGKNGQNTIQVKQSNEPRNEDQCHPCHHPNARHISPVDPWRKVYVKDVIEYNGRTWYWCPKHKMPDYNGLYVTHHPNDHEKWAEKVAEAKMHKLMRKTKNAVLSSPKASNVTLS